MAVPAPAPVPDSAGPTAYIIGISPFLDDAVKDDVYRSLVRLLVQGLPLNSTLAIYDAFDLKSITQVTIPNARAFESPKTRANQFASAIRDLKRFLAEPHARPTAPGLKFAGALRLPQFCDFLAANLVGTNAPASLLLLGSPLYQDNKEPGFSMVDGYFPSDAHLVATRDKSVFGLPPDPPSAGAQLVTWVYFAGPLDERLVPGKNHTLLDPVSRTPRRTTAIALRRSPDRHSGLRARPGPRSSRSPPLVAGSGADENRDVADWA